jgi:LuxR family maltose regulon positive regulatory protein
MSKPGNEPARRIENFLRNKLLPPRLHSKTIQRGALLARLDAGLTKKLILVTAPTGFGKTTLVRQWIESREFASAWVTLDDYDNDPSRFWTYVVSALRTFDPSIGKSTLSALMSPQPPSFQTLLTSLINDLEGLQGPCVLS